MTSSIDELEQFCGKFRNPLRQEAYNNFSYVFNAQIAGFGKDYELINLHFNIDKGEVDNDPDRMLKLAFDHITKAVIKRIKDI